MDRYAVFGNPIAHSLSPIIHAEFARQAGVKISYEKILAPIGQFKETLWHFRDKKGRGANVTLPFKVDAFNCVDSLSARAQVAGAVNTITIQSDGLFAGDNTDGVGLVRDITQRLHWEIAAKRILILGAGGATRGILGSLLEQQPANIILCNRTKSKAEELADLFTSLGDITVCSPDDLKKIETDLIINATSIGIAENDTNFWSGLKLSAENACYDLVYSKQATPFLRWVKTQGCKKISDGLGMLIEQAAESFYIWHKIRPDTKPVFRHICEFIRHQHS